VQKPDLLSKIITGDESWVFVYDPEVKHRSSKSYTKSSLGKTNLRVTKSEQKVLLVAFFNSLGVVHHKFVSVGQSEAFD
jgi:hypothetical protein